MTLLTFYEHHYSTVQSNIIWCKYIKSPLYINHPFGIAMKYFKVGSNLKSPTRLQIHLWW